MPESTKSPAEVLETVRRLTATQRRVVLSGYIGDVRMDVVRRLQRMGLFERRDMFPGSAAYTLELSPFGKDVQEVLKPSQASRRGGEG